MPGPQSQASTARDRIVEHMVRKRPCARDAQVPLISLATTMHHGSKHHQAQGHKLNKLVKGAEIALETSVKKVPAGPSSTKPRRPGALPSSGRAAGPQGHLVMAIQGMPTSRNTTMKMTPKTAPSTQ